MQPLDLQGILSGLIGQLAGDPGVLARDRGGVARTEGHRHWFDSMWETISYEYPA